MPAESVIQKEIIQPCETVLLAPNSLTNKDQALDHWCRTPLGHRVALAFDAELRRVFEGELRGQTLLQLGQRGKNPWLSYLRFRHTYVIPACFGLKHTACVAMPHALPFERNSVDCVVAPLTMACVARDQNPIDELDRVLKPMGHLIFFDINPWSIWGAAWHLGGFSGAGEHNNSSLTSGYTINRALQARGYKTVSLTHFYYIPPVTSPYLIQTLAFLNQVGKLISPFPAGFYCLIVQKHEPGMMPLLIEQRQTAWLRHAPV